MKIALFFMLLLISLSASAQHNSLNIALADDRVDITTGFDGTRVVLFGTWDIPDADLIVTLKGPEQKVVVRRKSKVLGAWINREKIEFRQVPSYYDYASSISEAEMQARPALMHEARLGVDSLDFYQEQENESEAEQNEYFRDGLIRGMQSKGFFPIKPKSPVLLSDGFFKVAFDLPPGVPTGVYAVETLLVKGDDILTRETQTLQVGQVGFNAQVYLFAQNYAFFYGAMAVLMAVISGWSAFTFLRRD